MNMTPTPATLALIFSVFSLLAAAWVSIARHRGGESGQRWISSAVLALNLIAVVWISLDVLQSGAVLEWKRNWIWSASENGAIGIGMLVDPAAVLLLGVSWFLACGFLVSMVALRKEPRAERIYGGILFGLAGAEMSAVAGTPWLALFGLAFAILGGYFGTGTRSHVDLEARLSVRYVWERCAGLALIVTGLCGRASNGEPGIGNWLVLIGLFIQLHPFPFTGWLVGASEIPAACRAITGQLLPAAATFAMLYRIEPSLHGGMELKILPWIFLCSAVLTAVSSLAQTAWKSGFSSLTSSIICLPPAALAMGLRNESLLLLASALAGTAAVALCVSALGHAHAEGNRSKGTWSITLLMAATGAIVGAPGFGSAGGYSAWWSSQIEALPELILLVSVAFLIGFAAWKLAWDLLPLRAPLSLSWPAILSPMLPLIPSLGLLWSGQVSGGLFAEEADLVWKGPIQAALPTGSVFPVSSIILLTAIVIQVILAAWLTEKISVKEHPDSARFLKFLASGYRTERAGALILEWTMRVVSHVDEFLDHRLWRHGARDGVSTHLQKVWKSIRTMDRAVAAGIIAVPRRLTHFTGDLMQRALLGDVQAYVLFVMATVLVLLVRLTIR